MAKVRFAKPIAEFEIDTRQTLMEALLAHGLPVASSCKGDGICGKCKIEILEGAENLNPKTSAEVVLSERLRFSSTQRLSCQAKAHGDVKIDTAYW